MTTSSGYIEPKLEIIDAAQPHTFIVPVKNINEGHDVSDFLLSRAYSDIMTFVLQLNRAMIPFTFEPSPSAKAPQKVQHWDLGSPEVSFSETVRRLRNLLDDLNKILDEVPPDPGPRRFGNASFRTWSRLVEERAGGLLERHLPASVLSFNGASEVSAKKELELYLLGSFGSPQRLDYGTGHELSFIAFLGCVWKLGGFIPSASGNEERGIVLGLFEPYLALIRRLIKTYTLEPAGSHGVWGLDDHSFLPYLFGSAQYAPAVFSTSDIPTEGACDGAPDPADVTKVMTVERERKKNLYFGAIGFIYDVKKGPFWEHSPMLFDISGVRAGWAKINKGMIKMYNAEVLSKFPVVQHFRFGSLFSWERDPNAIPPPASAHASSQPVKEDRNGPSVNYASSRSQPGTKAPLATQATTLPNSSIGTSAPWASGPTPAVRMRGIPSRLPQPGSTRPPPQTRLPPNVSPPQKAPESTSAAADPASQSMPPPTRAPWAKPDT